MTIKDVVDLTYEDNERKHWSMKPNVKYGIRESCGSVGMIS